ncbi:HDOD domain-containing protein [Azovibrio restrictus]|uniref:HDOD domain-containing protein n=1 Tax=Azovibrio restrictus TaxID=146938 RepID=UPI0003FA9442|nr:HDOD domain-containing protein [Azovibrio restrictus]MCE1170767.1 HDOD domain-containing protein [Azovibrio sp.]
MTDPASTNALHFRILEDIAKDLSGDVNFPTYLDASLTVRNVLKDPLVSVDKVAQVVGVEPLIASKLLRLANSVAYNSSGKSISDLRQAIQRVGFETVRTTSLSVAMEQMLRSRNLVAFEDIARLTWEHSLQVAAIGRVLARRIGRVNPEDAMLAGMVHDIGVFYLLYRAAEYPEYKNCREDLLSLVIGWHESIGESLLTALGLPDHIISAIREHDQLKHVANPCSLADVLYFANLLAGGNFEWLGQTSGQADTEQTAADRARYADLLDEAWDDIRAIQAALST